MEQNFITLTIGKQKNIALIAHDNKKKELIAWCDDNKEILKKHMKLVRKMHYQLIIKNLNKMLK